MASNCRARSIRSINTSSCSRTRSRKWSTSTRSRPSFPREPSTSSSTKAQTVNGGLFPLMFDRPGSGTEAVLVSLDFGPANPAESLDEARQLAASAGIKAVAVIKGRRQRPDAAFYAGSGKVGEVADAVAATGAGVVIFNHDLTPVQERNLEKRLNCRVVD